MTLFRVRWSSVLACIAVAIAFAAATTASAQTATPLERGRYLVTTILACGNCHTPKDADGRPIAARELAGGGVGFDIPPYAGTAANITPDRETGIGAWSDDEIRRALVQGIARDGRKLQYPMPWPYLATLNAADVDSLVAWLRSLPPKQ